MMPRDQERQGNRFGEPAAKEQPFANRSRTWTGDLFGEDPNGELHMRGRRSAGDHVIPHMLFISPKGKGGSELESNQDY